MGRRPQTAAIFAESLHYFAFLRTQFSKTITSLSLTWVLCNMAHMEQIHDYRFPQPNVIHHNASLTNTFYQLRNRRCLEGNIFSKPYVCSKFRNHFYWPSVVVCCTSLDTNSSWKANWFILPYTKPFCHLWMWNPSKFQINEIKT